MREDEIMALLTPTLPKVRKRVRWQVRVVRTGAVLVLGWLGVCSLIAWETVRPKPRRMQRTPADLGMAFENIAFASSDGTRLRGWLIPTSGQAKGLVICCHGVDGTRASMLTPAHILHGAGYAVILFDFRARGESGGTRCTLGWRETDDLLAAIQWTQTRADVKNLPVGVLGESMGGAVALMATARSPLVRCVIAESPFARLDRAVAAHFACVLGRGGPVLGVPSRWLGEQLIGNPCETVAPLEEIAGIAPRPLLLIADGADGFCPLAEVQSLYAAAHTPKTLWVVPDADHIRARVAQPDEYARRLTAFYAAHLR